MNKNRNLFLLMFIFSIGILLLSFLMRKIPSSETMGTTLNNILKSDANKKVDQKTIISMQVPLKANEPRTDKPKISESNVGVNSKSNSHPNEEAFDFSKLTDEQFSSFLSQYSRNLPKTIGKKKLIPGGGSTNDTDDLKKRAYEGDPGAQFLYANRLSFKLIHELLNENAQTNGNANITKWLEKHEEARSFLIESAVATGHGSAIAHLGVVYGLSPISDNVESLAWFMISQNMGYPGMLNTCAKSNSPCTTEQFLNAQLRAKDYLDIYSFEVEK